MMMRRIRNHPTALILPARTVLKKVAGKNSVKSFLNNLSVKISVIQVIVANWTCFVSCKHELKKPLG